MLTGSIEVKESVPMVCNKSQTICTTCSSSKLPITKNGVKKQEISCQTEENDTTVVAVVKNRLVDVSTQTASRWVQISLNSPPLSLTQEVPDVVL